MLKGEELLGLESYKETEMLRIEVKNQFPILQTVSQSSIPRLVMVKYIYQ